ncbi:ABC transporter permease [Thalassotalea fusca]
MTLILVIQIAFTMGVLSSSVLVSTATLSEWNLPSGIPHNDIIRVSPEFFEQDRDVGQAIIDDVERVKQFPSVVSVTPSTAVPFTAENVVNVYLETGEDAQGHQTVIFDADESIISVLDLSLIEGRWITENDVIRGHAEEVTENASIMMISQDMAKTLFPASSAVGQTVWLSNQGEPAKIIGVYSNFMTGERLNGRGKSYHSFIRPQVKWAEGSEPHYLIRMEPGVAESKLEDVVTLFYQERGRYINFPELLKRTQKRMYDGRGSRALTFLVISGVLLLITAIGITGLTAFQVNQRKKQIGTRRALGAKKSDIIKYFLTENSIITLFGLLIGLLLTFSLTFEISEQYGQNMLNLSVVLGTAALIWSINMVAVWFPAKRAANVAPAIVTRTA